MRDNEKSIIGGGVIENKAIPKYEVQFGKLYLLNTPIVGIQKELFKPIDRKYKLAFINSPFEGAIRIVPYLKKHREGLNFKELIHLNKLDGLKIHEGEPGLNYILLVVLNELLEKDILLIETTGLDLMSTEFLLDKLKQIIVSKPDKLIVIVQNEYIGMSFHDIELIEIL